MFNKLPTAWLQLRHQKMRLIVALAGVVFAVVIVFMQLGLRDALFDSAVRLHKSFKADCFLISPRSTALVAMQSFPERRLLQTLAFPEVDIASSIYISGAQWKHPETKNYWRLISIIGFDLRHDIFNLPGLQENIEYLKIPDVVLFDEDSRAEFGPVVSQLKKNGSVVTELGVGKSNHRIEVKGLFKLGTSFGSDGNLITSDRNFLQIFNDRDPHAINVGVIKLNEGVNVDNFIQKMKKYLPNDVKILSKEEFIQFEKNYWQSGTAIGFIFSFGVVLGIMVGMVVVYQILYTNVSEHLPEYATLKAMGYRHQYLLSMVLQQAFFIAILGYLPGLFLSVIQYEFTKKATLLPIAMTWDKAILVLVSTIIMCFISGAIAIRKLQAADPADIF